MKASLGFYIKDIELIIFGSIGGKKSLLEMLDLFIGVRKKIWQASYFIHQTVMYNVKGVYKNSCAEMSDFSPIKL